MSILVLSTPTKKQYLLRIAFLGGYIVLNLFSTVYPPKKAIRVRYCFFGGVDSTKMILVLCTPIRIGKYVGG